MKKLTLSIGLLAGILTSNAQDTTCTMIQTDRVLEFNYKTNEVINVVPNKGSYFINVRDGEVLVLHLYDKIDTVRTVITTFPDNSQLIGIFNSKADVYYSPLGPCIVEVKGL
jgi:uncharacterized protein (DUF1330 family)